MLCVCVCSLSYPACNAHAPYCHLWPVWLCNIFRPYLITSTIFEGGKKYWPKNAWFDFLNNFFSFQEELSELLYKCTCMFTYRTPYFGLILTKLDCTRQILEKYSNLKFCWKAVHWEPSSTRRDGRTDMTKLIDACRQFFRTPLKSTPHCLRIFNSCGCRTYW